MSSSAPSELRLSVLKLSPSLRRATLFSICTGLLVLAPSAYMLEVYDRVVNSRNHLTLAMLTLAVVGAYAVMEILDWARSGMLHEAGRELDRNLGTRVFDAMFAARQQRAQGGTTQALSDLRIVRDFVSSPAVSAIMEAPVAIVFLALLFAISPILGVAALAGAILQVVLGFMNERATQPPLVAANRSSFMAQQYADNTLRNAQVIEAMGMIKDIHGRWMTKQREFLGLQALASERAGGFSAVTKLLQNTLSSGLLGLGAWLLLHNDLNGGSGMMIIGSVLGGRVLAPLVQLLGSWRAVIDVRDAWGRLEQLLEKFPAPGEAMPLPAPKGRLTAEQLLVMPPGSPAPVLRGVHFALEPGEAVAVIGPSASGKTSLARVLMGLWPSAGGKVRLDGVDVYAWDKGELGPCVGYLPQGVELFDGTLADNISRFGGADAAKVEAAARAVGLHEQIMQLPKGYDTEVGRDGGVLSGGQRQRVGLARAIYDEPAFVVLDEPNSSLDEAGDAALLAAIAALKAKGTSFVVMTHRTNVLGVIDKILVLKDGQMQAFGSRDEIMAAMAKANAQSAQQAQQRGPKAALATS